MSRQPFSPRWIAFKHRRAAAALGAARVVALAWASTFGLFWQLHWPRWIAFNNKRSAAASLAAGGVSALVLFWQVSGSAPAESGMWASVEAEAVERTITAEGPLVEASAVTVVAPFEGTIIRRWVQPGDRVEKGDPLIELNTDSVKAELREAQAADIRAQEELTGVLNWQTGIEMTAAQRQVFSAKRQVQAAAKRLAETRALFDKGIVARSELDGARFELANATEQLHNAKDGLASTALKGGASQLQLARLGAESSSAKLLLLQERLKAATLTAPIAGQVFKPVRVDTAVVKELEVGTVVSSRDALMMIGDTTQHMVRASLDEFDVARVKPGLAVEVTLNTDDKVRMPGELVRVSAQSRSDQRTGSSAGVPMFDIEVAIRKVPPELKPRLRLGMSTRLRMVVASQPSALTVPLAAVHVDSNGRSTVIRRSGGDRKDDGKGEATIIETGATMADRIVVLKGLAAGDAVWLPPTKAAVDATAQTTPDEEMDSPKSLLPF